jgi:hypothetical protein
MASPSSAPTMAAGRHVGSDRNRSKMPFSASTLRPMPVYIVIITTVATRMPGRKNCR